MKGEKSGMDNAQDISGFDESMVKDFLEIDSAYNYLTEPAVRQAIQELKLPSGSRGLEVGCGPGLHTLWLAEAVTPDGRYSMATTQERVRCPRDRETIEVAVRHLRQEHTNKQNNT